MPKLTVEELTRLPKETKNFTGVSLPAFKGHFFAVDLDAYQAHLTTKVGEKMKMDGGLSMKFAGFTDAAVLDMTSIAENPEVRYSTQRKMFVFKGKAEKDFYAAHETLSSAYNDVSTIRKDKTFLCGNYLYCYDAVLGIDKISSIKVVSSLEAPATDEAASTQLVKETAEALKAESAQIVQNVADDLDARKVEKELGKGLSSEDYTTEEKIKLATLHNYDDTEVKNQLGSKVEKVPGKGLSAEDYTADEKAKLAGIEEGAQKNVLSVQELGDSETDVVSQKVSTKIANGATMRFDRIEEVTKPIEDVKLEGTPDAIIYDTKSKRFVYQFGDRYVNNFTNGDYYNETVNGPARKDKIFICNDVTYIYDAVKGLTVNSGGVSQHLGDSETATISQNAITGKFLGTPANMTLNKGFYIDETGNLQPETAVFYSSPIYFKAGDRLTIRIKNNATSVLAKTDADGTYYKPIIIGETLSLKDYYYVVTESGYYAVSGFTGGLYVGVNGIEIAIHILEQNIDVLKDTVKPLEREEIAVKLNDDSFIDVDGTLYPYRGATYSDPFELKAGQAIVIKSLLQGGAVLAKTDDSASFYEPIIIGKIAEPLEYTYVAKERGFYAVSGVKKYLSVWNADLDERVKIIESKEHFRTTEKIDTILNEGAYIDENGGIVNASGTAYSAPVPLKKGDVVEIHAIIAGTTVIARKKNGIYIPCHVVFKGSISEIRKYVFQIKEDGDYCISGFTSGLSLYKVRNDDDFANLYTESNDVFKSLIQFRIDENGKNINDEYKPGEARTNFYRVGKCRRIYTDITDDFELLAYAYRENGTFIEKIFVSSYLSVALPTKCYALRFVIKNKNGLLNVNNVKFNVFAESEYPQSILQRSNYLKDDAVIQIAFTFKEVKNGNLTESNIQDPINLSKNYLISKGIIKLPKNYTTDGEKTRLIIYAHSSANPYPITKFYADAAPYVDYLVAEGYAVADCCSWGSIDGDRLKFPSPIGQYYCTPTNIACYSSFYTYIINNFNIKDDGVFLCGWSHGGYQVYTLPEISCIPVIARASLAGATTPLDAIFAYGSPTQENEKSRMACLEDFGFSGLEKNESGNYIGEGRCMTIAGQPGEPFAAWTEERKAYFLKNIDKVRGYLPPYINNISENATIEKTFFSYPFMSYESWKALAPKIVKSVPTIFFGEKRDTGLTGENDRITLALQNGSNICKRRYVKCTVENPTIMEAHHAVADLGYKVDVVTRFGETVKDVSLAWAEMLDFFRHFE